MKIDVQDVSTVKKIINVEIPEARVTQELAKAFGTLRQTARIKGFRPGKVPMDILERRFKKEIHAEVLGQLIQDSYTEALRETKLVPLSEPVLDPAELEKGRPYHYSAEIEVRPLLEPVEIHGLKLKKKVFTVGDDEVEIQLKMLQKNQAQIRALEEDRPVQKGDYILVDYEGFKDGRPFEPVGKTENFGVEVGSGSILKDFDDQLIGMERNTGKELSLRFPDDYFNKELAGVDVTFKIHVNDIKEYVLPEIDDEFAKDLGQHETLADLKESIRKDLEEKYADIADRELRRDVLERLMEQQEFEVPEFLVKHELSALVSEAQSMLQYRGLSPEEEGQTEEVLSEKYRPLAEKRVRQYLLLYQVIEQEGITATDEVLKRAYEKTAKQMNQTEETIKQFHNAYSEAFEAFKQKAVEDEAVRIIIGNSTIETVEGKKGGAAKADPEAAEPEAQSEDIEDEKGGE